MVQSKKQMENHHDTGFIVLSAVRYAMGRRSYAVGMIIEWVKEFWDKLTPNDQSHIARDVKEYMEGDRSKGDDCDLVEWEDFNSWINNKIGS
jgi:hypothetical protein